MATTPLKYLNQYFTTTLNVGGGLDNSQTTGIVIQAVSGLDITKPGVACLTYADPINTSTAEWITYTSIDGSNELQGVVRGAEGFGAKTHSNGAVVAFPLSESHINNLNAMFDSTGLDIAQIATPANPSAGRNKIYPKSDGKFYTLTSAGVEATLAGEDGWITCADTWVYASASTFTIAGVDRTSMFPTGTRLKFTQTTTKYAVVVSSSFSTNTTVTIAVNTDYTIANAAITSPYYSYQLVPQGYPSQFAFTPSWNNFTVGSATQVASFSLTGKMVTVRVSVTLSSSTMGSGPELIMPIPRNSGLSTVAPLGWVAITDTGTAGFYGLIDGLGVLRLPLANSTYFGFDTVSATKPHTWANTDVFEFIVFYEAA